MAILPPLQSALLEHHVNYRVARFVWVFGLQSRLRRNVRRKGDQLAQIAMIALLL
jgi:hypothetical protein